MSKPVECRRSPKLNRPRWCEVWWALLRSRPSNFESQEELIGQLTDEIAELKGEKKRPRFKASGMEEKAGQEEKESETGAKKRAGSEKRSKTELLEIHEERVIAPEAIPAGSRFKGY